MVVHATSTANSPFTPNDPRNLRLDQVTTVLSVMLIILAAVNAILIAWATTLDTRHSSALARALGATPTQIALGISVAQILTAIPARIGARQPVAEILQAETP